MIVNLKKGETINLSKETTGNKFQLRAGWDVSLIGNPVDVDIMSAQINDSNEGIELVYYGNLKSRDESLRLSGDNRTGEGDGWDETIFVDTSKINSAVKRIPCFVSIYDAIDRGQNFGLVKNLKIQVFDEDNSKEIANFEPELEFGTSTAVLLGEFVLSNNNFYFKPIGTGYDNLNSILKEYKINA